MKHLMHFIFLIIMMMLFNACSEKQNTPLNTDSLSPKITHNIPYGKDSAQIMDIHLPANRSAKSTKIMILLHGGGWAYGDKSDLSGTIAALQQKMPDYAFFNVNYRLASQTSNPFPAQEHDVLDAIKFILQNANDYQVSSKVVLMGVSAGAHLALLQAYKHADVVQPAAVVSFFGPTDMADMYNNSTEYYRYGLQLLLRGTPHTNPALFASSGPIHFVSKSSAPTLLLHGAKDVMVPIDQSKKLKEKLERFNIPVSLVNYSSEAHGWTGTTLDDSFEKIEAFLKKYVP